MKVLMMVAACVLFVACGGGGGTSSKSATPETSITSTAANTEPSTSAKTDYVAVFHGISDPANKAGTTFTCALNKLPNSATGKDIAKLADPLADAFQEASGKFLEATWPSNMKADVRKMVADIGLVIGDLRSASTLTGLNAAQWSQTLSSHLATGTVSINIVRVDLGLPAKKRDTAPNC